MKFLIHLMLFIFFSLAFSKAYSAPIPEGAVFWIAYDDSLGGLGDRMMAEKLKSRIEGLGYIALTHPFSQPPSLAEHPAPSLIISVPHAYTFSFLPKTPVRVGVLQECGYAPSKLAPSLGIPAAMLSESAASSTGSSASNAAQVLREEGEEYFQGLLLDQELMSLYQRDPLKSLSLRAQVYLKLSLKMRSKLDPLLGLTAESTPEEIEHSLKESDLYFGYSHITFSQQYFTTVVEGLSKSNGRRPLVILTGGDLDSHLRERSLSIDSLEATHEGGSSLELDRESAASPFYGEAIHSSAAVAAVAEPSVLSAVEYFPAFFKLVELGETPVSEPTLLRLNRIDHADFKLLLYLSSLVLVTGDRSTEEAISAGTPMIYEVLHHKRGFAHQLQSIAPSGLISPLRMMGESMFRVNTYKTIERIGKLFGISYRVSSIVNAQFMAADPKEPYYFGFFKKMHDQAYMSDAVLTAFLESWFDESLIFPVLPESGFELGKKYYLRVQDMVALQISRHSFQSSSPEVCAKYQLTPEHRFEFNSLYLDGFIVSLQVR